MSECCLKKKKGWDFPHKEFQWLLWWCVYAGSLQAARFLVHGAASQQASVEGHMGNSTEMSDETNYATFKGTSACWIGLRVCFFFWRETFRQLSSVRASAVSSCTAMKAFACTAREDEGFESFVETWELIPTVINAIQQIIQVCFIFTRTSGKNIDSETKRGAWGMSQTMSNPLTSPALSSFLLKTNYSLR